MPNTTLHIPTLVRPMEFEGRTEYQVRPLFLSHPAVTHRRFNDAVSKFKGEIKRAFSAYVFSRKSMEQLLWFKFSPEVKLHHFNLQFSIGSNYVKGRFGVARFEWKDKVFCCLPSFDNFMFMLPVGKGQPSLEAKMKEIIPKLVKKYKQLHGDEFTAERFISPKKEFLTVVQQEVSVKEAKFGFDEVSMFDFFSSLRRETTFDGGEEVEKVAYDICQKYPDELSRAFYQEQRVLQLYEQIFHRENTPLVLIGPEGVGRHTLLEEVLWRYMDTQGGQGQQWKRHYFWHLSPNRVIAGMSIVGQWQSRFEAILEYVKKPTGRSEHPDKILIDDPVAMLRVGNSAGSNLNLTTVLRPYLEERSIQLVLIATPESWKVVQEADRGFSDLFQVIRLAQPNLSTALKMVLENRRRLEIEHECNFTVPAINQLFTIQRNFLKNKALPGSVMWLMTQLANKFGRQKIDAQEVRSEFKAFSGLEERIFDEQVKLEKDEVREMLERELVGQPEAVRVLGDAVHVIKAKLTDRSKPMASFLFIGPTGVGKTHAAKLLCKCLLGSEGKLLRFDMNEYIDGGALHRLIGDENNPEGQLTGKVRYQPFGVVLLDEIEKAHPSIHDLLLQVLDDARLTDSIGRTVDLSNTVIVMTSNLGAREAASKLGFGAESQSDDAVYRKAVENFFRPELVNRIENITIFNSLEFDQIQRIAQLQIRELLQRDGFVRRTTIVNVSPDALDWVARRGFDARMGGRALKRQIEKDLTLLSAEQLIKTKAGIPVILDITFDGERLVPHISPLRFCETRKRNLLPELPDENTSGRFFGRLLRRIAQLERQMSQLEQQRQQQAMLNVDEASADWQYFDFKEKVAKLKEDIQFKQLKYKERRWQMSPVIPYRLKRIFLDPEQTSRARKEALRDKFFQIEALEELREEYRHGSPQFDSAQTDFIVSHLDVTFLEVMVKGFLEEKTDRLTLHFESAVTHSGEDEVEWLMEKYAALLEKMEVPNTLSSEEKTLAAEGHNLFEILQGEVGIHLFYLSHQVPVPVKLTISLEGEETLQQNLEVIRIYDGMETLTDIRTGYSNTMNLTADEFKLLIFGGF